MRLLVSVSDASETEAAVSGGADIIDAKDPAAGALGAVRSDVFAAIVRTVGGRTPVSAALGDAASAAGVLHLARSFAAAGAAFIKIGFAEDADDTSISRTIDAAITGAREARSARAEACCGVVAVAYADTAGAGPFVFRLIDIARRAGASGVLLDTADKTGPGLCECLTSRTLGEWTRASAAAGLFSALAGRLSRDDIAQLHDVAPDIVGVRGAACIGGRGGRVSADEVRRLRVQWPSTMRRREGLDCLT